MKDLMLLTFLRIINGFTFKSGNSGTLIIFNELYPKGHDLEGQQVMHSIVGNDDYIMEDTEGWKFDAERDSVLPPVVTKKSLRVEDKTLGIRLAHELGMELKV